MKKYINLIIFFFLMYFFYIGTSNSIQYSKKELKNPISITNKNEYTLKHIKKKKRAIRRRKKNKLKKNSKRRLKN